MPDESRTDTTGNSAVSSGPLSSAVASAAPRDGLRIGNYVVAVENGRPVTLGKGGFGKTYLGTNPYLKRKVVIKVIHDIYSDDETVKERFFMEAETLSDLDHPHIARILTFGEDEGRLYYAMEYGDRGDLEKYVVEHSPLATSHVLDLALQAAEALEYTHAKGLLHRDIKPSNFVMCTKEGAVGGQVLKVIDFGLVKRLGDVGNFALTQSGQVLVSLFYASPEQIEGGQLDVRSDIYSLGLTIWFMLVGRTLFKSQEPTTVALERVRPGSSYAERLPQDLDGGLRDLLTSMMASAPEDRPQDMAEVCRRIRECRDNPRPETRSTLIQRVHSTLENEFTILHKLEGFKTPAFEATETSTKVAANLRWFRQQENPASPEWVELRKILGVLADACPPYILRPQRMIHFTDCTVIEEERGGNLTLKALAAATKGLTFAEALPLLVQLADTTDRMADVPGVSADLRPDHLFIHFPHSSWVELGDKNPMELPVTSWPPFLVRVQPDYTLEGLAEDDAPSAGATIFASLDDLVAQAPIPKFACTIYYLLAARRPTMGRAAQSGYNRLAQLGEASNDLLRSALAGIARYQKCDDLLRALVQSQNTALPPMILPEDVATLKGRFAPPSKGSPRDDGHTGSSGRSTGKNAKSGSSATAPKIAPPPPSPTVPKSGPPPPPSPTVPKTGPPPPPPPRPPAPKPLAEESNPAAVEDSAPNPAPPKSFPPKVELQGVKKISPPPKKPPALPTDATAVHSKGDTTPIEAGQYAPRVAPVRPPSILQAPAAEGRKGMGWIVMGMAAIVMALGGSYFYLRLAPQKVMHAGGIRDDTPKPKVEPTPDPAPVLAPEPAAPAPIPRPYKLLVSGRTSPSNATVLLDGKPLNDYGDYLPSSTRFPVKLQVYAPGFQKSEQDLFSTSSDRMLNVRLPTLSRLTGSVRVDLPAKGVDYPVAELKWVHALPGEDGAPPPSSSFRISLSATRQLTLSSIPTGRYEVALTGGTPTMQDQMLQLIYSVKSGSETPIADLPPTRGGTYTCEFEFPTPAGKPFKVRREIHLERGLVNGSGRETLLSGPSNAIDGTTRKPYIYPSVTIFSVSDIKFEPGAGVNGIIKYSQKGDGKTTRFTISETQIRFAIPEMNLPPKITPVKFTSLSGN